MTASMVLDSEVEYNLGIGTSWTQGFNMAYKAHIENGNVVLDEPIELSEGSQVLVEPVSSAPLSDLFRDVAGRGTDLPADGSVQHDHYISGTAKK
jgi:hypothetical protein